MATGVYPACISFQGNSLLEVLCKAVDNLIMIAAQHKSSLENGKLDQEFLKLKKGLKSKLEEGQ